MSVTIDQRLIVNALACLAGAFVMLVACAAHAQTGAPTQLGVAPAGAPQQIAPSAEPAPPPMPAQRPGLFGAIGRWMDNSVTNVTSGWGSARDAVGGLGSRAGDAAKGAAGAARDAAAAAAGVVTPGALVSGRMRCVRAANGGPDCETAAEVLCRGKGYASGSSLHIQTEQKCPVWGWIKGDKPVGKCNDETYVTRAMCR